MIHLSSATDSSEGSLAGKKIVITGTFDVSRDHIAELLEEHGAEIGTSISSKTDILIVGERSGSKYEKARKI